MAKGKEMARALARAKQEKGRYYSGPFEAWHVWRGLRIQTCEELLPLPIVTFPAPPRRELVEGIVSVSWVLAEMGSGPGRWSDGRGTGGATGGIPPALLFAFEDGEQALVFTDTEGSVTLEFPPSSRISLGSADFDWCCRVESRDEEVQVQVDKHRLNIAVRRIIEELAAQEGLRPGEAPSEVVVFRVERELS